MSAAVVSLAYAPVVVSRYGFIDDYTFLGQVRTSGLWDSYSKSLGRPFATVLLDVLSSRETSIGDLRWLRLASVVLLALLCAGLVIVLARSLPLPVAAATGVFIATLPCFQVGAAWAITLPNQAAVVLACGSACLVGWGRAQALWPERLLAFALGAVVLIAAFLAYQPGAMAFVAATLIAALLTRQSPLETLRRLVPFAVVAGISAFVAVIVNRVGASESGITSPRTELVSDLRGKADWFAREALPRALDPLSLHSRSPVAWLVGMAIVAGLFLFFHGSGWSRVANVGIALVGVPMVYGPNLAIQENWAAARSMVVLMPYVALLFLLALIGISESLRNRRLAALALGGVMAALAVVSAAIGSWRVVDYFVEPQTRELAAIDRRFRALVERGANEITFLQPPQNVTSAPSISYDEFGYVSSAAAWVPGPLLKVLGEDTRTRWVGPVTVLPPGSAPPLGASSVLDAGREIRRRRLETREIDADPGRLTGAPTGRRRDTRSRGA